MRAKRADENYNIISIVEIVKYEKLYYFNYWNSFRSDRYVISIIEIGFDQLVRSFQLFQLLK